MQFVALVGLFDEKNEQKEQVGIVVVVFVFPNHSVIGKREVE